MRAKKLLIRLIQSKKGFSLLEVLASSMVILTVAATVSQLSSHPKAVTKDLERKSMLVNYMHHKLQDLNQASTPLPTLAIRYCSSSCESSIAACASSCSTSYVSDCTSAVSETDLDIIKSNTNACYVSVLLDPTCDGNSDTKQSQICIGGKIQRPGGGDEHALTTYMFRS